MVCRVRVVFGFAVCYGPLLLLLLHSGLRALCACVVCVVLSCCLGCYLVSCLVVLLLSVLVIFYVLSF